MCLAGEAAKSTSGTHPQPLPVNDAALTRWGDAYGFQQSKSKRSSLRSRLEIGGRPGGTHSLCEWVRIRVRRIVRSPSVRRGALVKGILVSGEVCLKCTAS